jgi:hypothetical protein
MRRAPRATIFAAVSLALAVAASVWLVVWPCAYQGVSASAPGASAASVHTTCASVIDVNGSRIFVLVAIPIMLTSIALVAMRFGVRLVVVPIAIVYLALCVLALASIGLFYAPSAIALLAAAFTRPRRPAPTVAPSSG